MLKIKSAKEKDKKWIIATIVIAILMLFLFPFLLVRIVLGRTGDRTAADSGETVAFSEEEDDDPIIGSGAGGSDSPDEGDSSDSSDSSGDSDGSNENSGDKAGSKNSGGNNSKNTGDNASTKKTTPAIVHPSKVVLGSAPATITRDQSTVLSTTVSPANAANKTVAWTSSNPAVATVDGNGRVTALKKGVAVITAKTVDGGVAASTTITVSNPELVIIPRIGRTTMKYDDGTDAGLGVAASIVVRGGSGSYTSSIKLYCDGEIVRIGNQSVSSGGEGTYFAEWTVTDAEEGTRTDRTGTVSI